jgi:hypothetical protein
MRYAPIPRPCAIVLATLLLAALCAPAFADPTTQELIGTMGYIDWNRQRVVATGTGIPPHTATDPSHARAAARRAAVLDARRNLLEVIKNVRIDSSTVVDNLIVSSDTVKSTISGLLRGAVVDRENERPNGSMRVTVSLPLTGALARDLLSAAPGAHAAAPGTGRPSTNLPDEARLERRFSSLEDQLLAMQDILSQLQQVPKKAATAPANGTTGKDRVMHRLEDMAQRLRALEQQATAPSQASPHSGPKAPRAPSQAAGPATPSAPSAPPAPRLAASTPAPGAGAIPLPSPESIARSVQATGIVIDARGTDFLPSLKPRLTSRGNVVYPGPGTDFTTAVNSGYVRYYRDIATAQRSARAGASPLTLRGTGRGSDIELAAQDAALLRSLASAEGGNVLDQCRVVVVF